MEGYIGYILGIAALIIFSAYFSATETAFMSLNKTKIKALAEKKNRRAQMTLDLSEESDKLISTILIGNNIVNIAMSALATVLFIRLCGEDMGATVSTAVITVLVLIFGEISPKSIAKEMPEKFAMFSAPLIRMLVVLLTPVNFLFTQWKKLLARLFHLEADNKMSQEELLMLVEEVQQEGSIDESESELMKNVIEFNDLQAADVLTHRVDLEAVDITATKEEIAQVFSESKFSRLPVYEENIDNIIGVLHQKDFYTGTGMTSRPIREILAPAVFVLENEKISAVMESLQRKKSHVAVVLDEYGGTCGIVTLEDILEELVGDIWDEHDEVTEDIRKIDENTYRVDGLFSLADFAKFFDFETDCESVSVSGWISEQTGEVPEVGDHFQYENLDVVVTQVDSRRVAEAEIKVFPREEEDEDEPKKEKEKSKDKDKDKE